MATHVKKHIKNTGGKELVFRNPDDGEEYATIEQALGDARFKAIIYSNSVEVIAKARGALISGRNKRKIEKGDMVLIQLDGSTSKGDKYFITHKYSPDDVKRLRKANELAQIAESTTTEPSRVTVAFESDVVAKKQAQIEVNEDFIGDL